MSQAVEPKSNDITERIERLDQVAGDTAKLQSEKENVEEAREKRTQKNEAFDEVESEILDIEKTFGTLNRAVKLADHLDAQVPRSDIESILDDCMAQLRDFISKEYNDFEDSKEIRSTRKAFEDFQDRLDDQASAVKNNLKTVADAKLEEVTTRETVLRIPDVGTETDSKAVKTYKQKLEAISLGQIIDAAEFKDAKSAYESVDIDIGTIIDEYELSDKAGEMLLRFLRNETVTLGQVDEGVLDELKMLEEFSERLTIQF